MRKGVLLLELSMHPQTHVINEALYGYLPFMHQHPIIDMCTHYLQEDPSIHAEFGVMTTNSVIICE